jgi:hypothetical protein
VVVAVGARASSADGRFELVSLSAEVPVGDLVAVTGADEVTVVRPDADGRPEPTPLMPAVCAGAGDDASVGSTVATSTGGTTGPGDTPTPPATGVVPLDPADVLVTTTTTISG